MSDQIRRLREEQIRELVHAVREVDDEVAEKLLAATCAVPEGSTAQNILLVEDAGGCNLYSPICS